MRYWIRAGVAIVTLILVASVGPAAADFPDHNITLVVPFAAGGSTDAIARILGDHMARTLGKAIIIENDAGAGGTPPTRRVAQAPADGYTLIIGNLGTHGAAPTQYPHLNYDPAHDFTPIALTAGLPVVIVTRKNFPANNLKEFVDYVRTNQDKVNEAHGGAGGQLHTTCTLLQYIMGTKTARIAYRGAGPAMNDIVGGQVDFACISLAAVASQIQAGTMKAMAIASPERSSVAKDVPTTKEGGLPEYQVSAWNAIFAPKNLPPEIQAKLNDAVDKALDDEITRKRLLGLGAEIPEKAQRTPRALQEFVEKEVAHWRTVLTAAGAMAK